MEITQKTSLYKKLAILFACTTFIPSALLLMSLKKPEPVPAQTPIIITQEQANSYVNSYVQSATPTNAVVRAVTIESGVLTSMNNIAKSYPNTQSYHVYFGKDGTGAQVSIVVGISATGGDMTLPVYCSTRTGTNICPPMCDANSAIDPF